MKTKCKKIFSFIVVLLLTITLSACNFSNTNYIFKNDVQSISIGESTVLSLNVDSNDKIEWKSSDERIATVDEFGIVTGISGGITTITATVNGKTYSIYIAVDVKETVQTLEIKGDQTVFVDETVQLKAKVYNSTKNSTISWESSNEAIATVDSNGLVTGKAPGIVTIKASTVLDSLVEKEITILVRNHGSILEDTVNNYIEHKSIELDGTLDLTSLNKTTVEVVEKNYRSTIGVSNYIYYQSGLKKTLERNGIGTGIIFKREIVDTGYLYYVLTNYHVIKDNAVLKVYLGDIDLEIEAATRLSSVSLDLAVIAFRYSEDLPLVKFGTMDEVKAGQFVIALGNPEGYEYYGSATFGMISYVNRKLSGETSNFIQHDAAINPGNSGGPLFNLKGEVIGINTIKLADEDIDNMGFSIALDTIFNFLESGKIDIK